MNKVQKLELLDDLIQRTSKCPSNDKETLDGLIEETRMVFRNIFERSQQNDYMNSLDSIITIFNTVLGWQAAAPKLLNLLKTLRREIELFGGGVVEKPAPDLLTVVQDTETTFTGEKGDPRKVFIVHGHDDTMKLDVARTIEKLKLEAVILHEQDNRGQTVIEKFERHAVDCNFAVVLLSPDDIAYPRNHVEKTAYRARQNVILELGYFVGVIGRENVLPLVKNDPSGNLEIPSDYAGIVYTPYDNAGGWRMELVSALKSSGYDVNANDLF